MLSEKYYAKSTNTFRDSKSWYKTLGKLAQKESFKGIEGEKSLFRRKKHVFSQKKKKNENNLITSNTNFSKLCHKR